MNRHLYEVLLPGLYQRRDESEDFTRNWPASFMRSIVTGNVQGTQNFLRYGADVNVVCSYRLLRRAKVPIKPWSKLQTPLNVAANIGNDTLVLMLLDYGAKINGVHDQNWFFRKLTQPPIMDALLSGHLSTVRLLLEHGSDIQSSYIKAGQLVWYAVDTGQLKMLQLLKEFGADLGIARDGVYPLHKAAESREISTDIVRFLLDNGATFTDSDHGLGGFIMNVLDMGTIDTARLLLEHGEVFPQNKLYWAILCGSPDFILLLIEYGHKPDIEWLKEAIWSLRLDLLQLLVESIGFGLRDARGSTILHHAVERCRYKHFGRGTAYVTWGLTAPTSLLRRTEIIGPQTVSPPCTIQGNSKYTAEDVLRYLIQIGAEVNAADNEGRTPLDLARKYAPNVEQMLIDSGATSFSNDEKR